MTTWHADDRRAFALALAVLVGWMIACGGSRPATPRTVSATLTARQLFQAYADNTLAADDRYKGQWVRVSGSVGDIGEELTGRPYVTLDVGQIVGSVQAIFARDSRGQVAALSRGRQVTVECEVAGKLMNVILEDCVLR